VALTAIAALLAAAVGLQMWRDRGWTPYEPATPVIWLRNGEVVRRAALGFDSLVADAYWIRAVVYYGRQRLSQREDKNYDLLHPLLDLVTTLDPRFVVAYRFGAFFLSEPAPGGPGRPDQAVSLLERGAVRNPHRWEFPHDIGFVYAWSFRDYKVAAAWFERASQIPEAPVWLRSTAALMELKGGDRAAARQLWQQMLDNAELGWIKTTATAHLAQFDALDAIDQLNQVVWRYEARTGRMPESWEELVRAGVLRAVPVDPAGVTYELDQVNESVTLSRRSPLWPLPEGYASAAP
jgi:hypothetical protein